MFIGLAGLLTFVFSTYAFGNPISTPIAVFSDTPTSVESVADGHGSLYQTKVNLINNYAKLLSYADSLNNKTRGTAEASVFQKVSAGTVLILTETGSSGSGALITNEGHIVTNKHVVGDNLYVDVFFKPSGDSFDMDSFVRNIESLKIRGTVLKYNERADLALVKIKSLPTGARPIPMLNRNLPQVGEDAHAVGHPVGQLWTYTRGYISQVRTNHKWSATKDSEPHSATVIQTQTPINPGNSGGPLVNTDGELIGINTFKNIENPGLNYAVATETVQDFLRQDGNVKLRKENQESAPISQSQDPGQEVCGDKVVLEERGFDEELGNVTYRKFDPDCKGRISMVVIIPDAPEKSVFIMIEHESKENATGTMLIDENRDGQIDFTFIDTDGDGVFDFQGRNKPGEWVAGELNRVGG